MYICFENPGAIHPISFQTFGVSAKENENAIGFFGTGLKYAIAIVLRLGGTITICSDEDYYDFDTQLITVRGKEFEVVTCNGATLGFTTELGKTWEPWMAYRELYANCLDESGDIQLADSPRTKKGHTCIYIGSAELMDAHNNSHEVFLRSEPVFASPHGEIHRRSSSYIYYQGFRVAGLERPSTMTYNITRPVPLTEDRTLKYSWTAKDCVAQIISSCPEERIVREAFSGGVGAFEYEASFGDYSVQPTDDFMEIACRMHRKNPMSVPKSLDALIRDRAAKTIKLERSDMSSVDQQRLNKALAFAARLGYHADNYEIIIMDTLGPQVLAMARPEDQEIILSKRVFEMGTKQLAATLIEEIVHLRDDVLDCTRAMQDLLFDKIVSLGEQLTGELL